MPFTMTHLHVSKKMADTSHITNLPQFYLGSLAPDAVHCRQNYISDYKKAAHLCVGDEEWGHCTNNDEWAENTVSFLRGKRDTADFDFYYGYCTHILTDIYNSISIWTPFRRKHANETRSLYHFESGIVDLMLYYSCPFREEIWACLKASRSFDLPGLVYAEEVDMLKSNVLHSQYTKQPGDSSNHDGDSSNHKGDSSNHKIVTYDGALEFARNAYEYTVEMLKNVVK